MTKNELLTQVATRLGDNTADFKTNVLSDIFDQVIAEMAMREAIKPLRKTTTFAFVEDTGDYDVKDDVIGGGATEYPVDLISLNVPRWGARLGVLERRNEDDFLRIRSGQTNSDGTVVTGQPRYWTLTPNERTLSVAPVPDADADAIVCTVIYLALPTVLNGGDEIDEIRREALPVVIAGCLKYGSVFQDETLIDRNQASIDFEVGIRRMKAFTMKERRRDMRVRPRD